MVCIELTFANGVVSQVRYLNHDWLIYDNTSKQLYPFVKKNKENLPLHLSINTEDYKGLYLALKSENDISLYINNRFYNFYKGGVKHYVPLDSVETKNKSTLLSFFGKYNSTLIDSISIAYNSESHKSISTLILSETIKRDSGRSYFAIFLLASCALFVFFRNNYTKAFSQYLNLQDLFLNFKAEPSQTRSNFEGYYFAFVLIGSVFFGLACSGLPLLNGKYYNSEFLKYYLNVFNLIVVAWFFYFLKYLVIQSVSWLFSIGKFATMHFKVFIRISLMWSLVLVLVNMCGQSEFINMNHFLLEAFLLISLFFLTMISLKISFLINQVSKISTLYLISYLCITEWLPYFIILKLYMVYFY